MDRIPSRLHHNAYVVQDQRVTQHFYETSRAARGVEVVAEFPR